MVETEGQVHDAAQTFVEWPLRTKCLQVLYALRLPQQHGFYPLSNEANLPPASMCVRPRTLLASLPRYPKLLSLFPYSPD